MQCNSNVAQLMGGRKVCFRAAKTSDLCGRSDETHNTYAAIEKKKT